MREASNYPEAFFTEVAELELLPETCGLVKGSKVIPNGNDNRQKRFPAVPANTLVPEQSSRMLLLPSYDVRSVKYSLTVA